MYGRLDNVQEEANRATLLHNGKRKAMEGRLAHALQLIADTTGLGPRVQGIFQGQEDETIFGSNGPEDPTQAPSVGSPRYLP